MLSRTRVKIYIMSSVVRLPLLLIDWANYSISSAKLAPTNFMITVCDVGPGILSALSYLVDSSHPSGYLLCILVIRLSSPDTY